MNKKQYITPEIEVIVLQQQCQILAGSDLSMYNNQEDEIIDPTLIW